MSVLLHVELVQCLYKYRIRRIREAEYTDKGDSPTTPE